MTVDTLDETDYEACFCFVPLKPGAMGIAITMAAISFIVWIAMFCQASYWRSALSFLFLVISLAGLFFIWTNNQLWCFIYGCVNTVIQILVTVHSVMMVLTMDCGKSEEGLPLTEHECRATVIVYAAFAAFLHLIPMYCAYVIFDFTFKLRRTVAKVNSHPVRP